MKVTDLLANNGYILYNKQIAKAVGINEAIILGELASEYGYWESNNKLEDGWFYSTIENVEQSTALSAYQQRCAIKTLEDEGYIEVQQRGIPCKRYFRFNFEILNNKMLKNLTTGCEKTSQQEVKKLNGNNNKEKNNKKNNKNIYRPTLDEIKEYIKEKNLNVDAQFFYDYFTEGDWIDSNGNPVRNWKQKLITWSKKNENKNVTSKPKEADDVNEHGWDKHGNYTRPVSEAWAKWFDM